MGFASEREVVRARAVPQAEIVHKESLEAYGRRSVPKNSHAVDFVDARNTCKTLECPHSAQVGTKVWPVSSEFTCSSSFEQALWIACESLLILRFPAAQSF
jgi:hypothetical protein